MIYVLIGINDLKFELIVVILWVMCFFCLVIMCWYCCIFWCWWILCFRFVCCLICCMMGFLCCFCLRMDGSWIVLVSLVCGFRNFCWILSVVWRSWILLLRMCMVWSLCFVWLLMRWCCCCSLRFVWIGNVGCCSLCCLVSSLLVRSFFSILRKVVCRVWYGCSCLRCFICVCCLGFRVSICLKGWKSLFIWLCGWVMRLCIWRVSVCCLCCIGCCWIRLCIGWSVRCWCGWLGLCLCWWCCLGILGLICIWRIRCCKCFCCICRWLRLGWSWLIWWFCCCNWYVIFDCCFMRKGLFGGFFLFLCVFFG